MSIDKLLSVVRPPADPIDGGNDDLWYKATARLGIALPEDLRLIARHYGSGRFAGTFIEVFNPCHPHYAEIMDTACMILREGKETYPETLMYDVYPRVPGVLPWGSDENGNKLAWLVDGGNNARWPTIVMNIVCECERWDLSITEFLAKALTNEIDTLIWRPFEPEQREFHRGRTQREVGAEMRRMSSGSINSPLK